MEWWRDSEYGPQIVSASDRVMKELGIRYRAKKFDKKNLYVLKKKHSNEMAGACDIPFPN